MTTIKFELLANNTVEVWTKDQNGPWVTFDAGQLPSQLANVIAELVSAQQTDLATKTNQIAVFEAQVLDLQNQIDILQGG
jgi:polyhydroxyalkanoate synthesis regulator phasin